MKALEILTFIIAVLQIVSLFKHKRTNNRVSILLILFLLILSIIITVQNGVVWYYYLIYVFLLINIILTALKTKRSILVGIILSIMILLSIVSAALFPYYETPKPQGESLVGTKVYDLIDNSRIEKYDNSGNKRKIRLQVWFPIDSNRGLEQALWLYDGIKTARGLSVDSSMPFFVLDKTAKIKSNSYIGGTISSKASEYPVVIISHGWAGARNLHQDLAEELASCGYIVFGIDHTYGSAVTVFDDNKEARINYEALPAGEPDFDQKAVQLVNTYADDAAATIDFIQKLNQTDPIFAGKIDVKNLGLLGHSTGGGADVRLALKDTRIRSLIGMDAWVEPIKQEYIETGLNIPALFLRSESWETGTNNINLKLLVDSSSPKPVVYQIDDTTHYDFAMIYMYSSAIKLLGFSGSIDRVYLTKLLKDTVVSFFEQTLKDNLKTGIQFADYQAVRPGVF